MSDCCGSKAASTRGSASPAPEFCPACGKKGKNVERITIMALLTPAARVRLNGDGHRFCPSSDCDVVYFGARETYARADLNVRVGQKETDPSRLVCYCFNHTVQSIIDEIAATGKPTAVDSIKAEIQAKRCACEVTNPQGTCCLGNVGQAIKEIVKE
jgi:hypothetical protein